MPEHSRKSAIYRVSGLSPRKPQPFEIVPAPDELQAIADDLGILGLRKLRFTGELSAEGKADWRMDGHLGATVTQACVVTLEPVNTRIEEDVARRFLEEWPPLEEKGEEVEMPEDETIDPLGEQIDLWTVMTEALALALPPYPRADDAELETDSAIPPGAAPIEDEETKPFAGLADLKKKLEDGGD
uniref:YceD family protein n=1 Tax=Roseovarius indicus TaxID=540747 RepID=UPI003B5298B0